MHGRIQAGFLHAERDAEAVASGDFVAEDEEQQILMRHLLLAREREALRQGVEHARELEPAQDGFQIRTDRVGGHWDSSPVVDRAAARSGNAYWVAGRR